MKICADFLAGAQLDNGNPESAARIQSFGASKIMPSQQKRTFLETRFLARHHESRPETNTSSETPIFGSYQDYCGQSSGGTRLLAMPGLRFFMASNLQVGITSENADQQPRR
jgi:hypothetical protein